MNRMSLELADWAGLKYYMIQEESPTSHIVLVENRNGKNAIFSLENGFCLKGDLNFEEKQKATSMIRDSKSIFLEYWQEIESKIDQSKGI